jgi:hypothetical protein
MRRIACFLFLLALAGFALGCSNQGGPTGKEAPPPDPKGMKSAEKPPALPPPPPIKK